MSTADAENLSFIRDERPAKLRNKKIIIENNFLTSLLINVIKMNVLRTPLKVVDELSRAITLLENEGVVK
jgi:hypothetical protein